MHGPIEFEPDRFGMSASLEQTLLTIDSPNLMLKIFILQEMVFRFKLGATTWTELYVLRFHRVNRKLTSECMEVWFTFRCGSHVRNVSCSRQDVVSPHPTQRAMLCAETRDASRVTDAKAVCVNQRLASVSSINVRKSHRPRGEIGAGSGAAQLRQL